MPKAFLKTKSSRGKYTYTCVECGEPIEEGEQYYEWKQNFGSRFFQHAEHGAPKRSQLSESKMGAVWDAADDFNISRATSPEDISSALNEVAEAARSVAQAYGESADNIVAHWPSGNPTSEACRTIQEELESWADDLEGWEPEEELEAGEEEQWLEGLRESAQDIVNSTPEYQG